MKKKIAYIVLGAVICSFGIYNIHQQTGVTEGGVIGTMLLIHHWLGLKPSVITPILDISCYIFAYKYLGSSFIKTSIISTMSVSLFLKFGNSFRQSYRIYLLIHLLRQFWEEFLSEWEWDLLSDREVQAEEMMRWRLLFQR